MARYTIRLCGPQSKGSRISASVLQSVLNVLIQGSQAALPLKVEGRSTSRGPQPAWLEPAADFLVVGISSGSTCLEIEARPLAATAPDRFGQGSFLVDNSRSALSFCRESLDECLAGHENSDTYDDGLLKIFTRFSGAFEKGIESLELRNGERKGTSETVVQPEGIKIIQNLRKQTPKSRRVRIAGTIDMIRHSDKQFTIVLSGGSPIRGIATEMCERQLQTVWGEIAVVSGLAVYRPSGSILRVESDHIEPAKGDVSVWSVEPKPFDLELHPSDLRRAQGPKSGINAIIGRWPGGETDEEIESALREIS